jgi:hypothetical protein
MTDGPRWETQPEARVKFMVPSTWTTTTIDDKTIRITAPAEVGIEFRTFTMGAPEALMNEKLITDELKDFATDISIKNQPTKWEQHGLSGFGLGGAAKRNGKTVAWFTITLGDRKGHGVLAFGFGEVEQFKGQYGTILQIMQSIQPIEPPAAAP